MLPQKKPSWSPVVGASARQHSVGQAVFHNLLRSGYTGTVYPVNARHSSVMGVRSIVEQDR